ncbi:VCBS repeat-containing protein [Ramlibacter henchirensis]|uniref:VCBS repeat-containing protein n=1 Tax=Ramlibacter henchirensis TaxID=204072 RepID=A0A4Z0C9Q4_9BURK|nr:VCBS repeat-containing protein [Ramlibacter henchirensis]TFZ07138.1 VCBS repeat-containing protein [Ramlibacter henchirensis]
MAIPIRSVRVREPLRRLLLLLLFMATALAASVAAAATTPAAFSRSDLPLLGNNVIAADVNGDGRQDLVGTGGTSVRVRLSTGEATFGDSTSFPTGSSSQDVAAGDFNGDGRIDLAVTLNDPALSLSLLVGNGDGTFQAPVNFPNTSGFDSPAIVAADLNNDSKLDVVIGHQVACFTAPCRVGSTITVMLGNGDGTFQPAAEIDIGLTTAEIAVGDFNRDGRRDLAIASSTARLVILLGAGNGTFVQQPTLTLIAENAFGQDATDVDVADFNGDGIEDLVVALGLNGSRTAVLTGNGDGSFRMPPLLITEPNILIPQSQAVGDFNGDGFTDIALALGDGTMGIMEILNGNGDGTFQPLTRYYPPPDRSSVGTINIIAAQLTSDAKPDLVLGLGGAFPATTVLINTTGQAAPPRPAAPTLLSPATDATVSQPVTFDWNDVPNATSYEIQVDDSSNFGPPFRATRTVNVSQATIGSLPAARLFWRVRAINSAGVFGPFSSPRRFTARLAASPPGLAAVSVSPTTVVGGNQAQGTVTLTGAAPAGGALVTLSSSNANTVMLPPSVTVAAGATTAAFVATTTAVSASVQVTVGGTYADVTRNATLTVVPTAEPAGLSAVSVNPASVTGGSASQGVVTLSAAAPAGGLVVALSSNSPAATTPASVTVPQGATSASFAIATTAVSASTAATITAGAAGVTRTAVLTVTPPAQTVTLTVTASGRGGERITSSPAGINVAVGTSGAASFASGTRITLSATNGRDVIWSGACSSGGNKTRSCAFTISGNAAVNANVQ